MPEQPLSLPLQGEGGHRAGRDHGASRSHPLPLTSRPSVLPTVRAVSANRRSSSQWRYISSPPSTQGTVVCCDYQEIQVQERIQMLKVGTMPRSISVILLNDLVDMCKVHFSALSHSGWRRHRHHRRRTTAVEAADPRRHVRGGDDRRGTLGPPGQREGQRPLPDRRWVSSSLLTQSSCRSSRSTGSSSTRCSSDPSWAATSSSAASVPTSTDSTWWLPLTSLTQVKLSLLLILIGGVSNRSSEKNPVRGQSHLLVVGDSSTGKSQLLLFASKIAIRSVMTTGLGTTRLICVISLTQRRTDLLGGARRGRVDAGGRRARSRGPRCLLHR